MARPVEKRRIKVTKVVDGHPVEEWIEIEVEEGPSWGPREEHRLLDTDLRRVDGPAKVSGRAKYAHDVRLPDMVYARLLLCPHPSAAIRRLDVEPARRVPGVVDALVLEDERTGFLGQPVAAVCAETPEQAEDGLRAVEVEYEELGWSVTPEQARREDAEPIGRRGNALQNEEHGDPAEVEAALAASDAVVEATYRVPVQHHVCLETHGLVVDYRGGDHATVYASTQTVHGVKNDVAGVLDLRPDQVEVIVDYMGGGFGSKFFIGVEGQTACRFAQRLERPVHLMLTRADEFLMAGNRSGGELALTGGASADGRLTALRSHVWRYGGLARGSSARQPYIYAPETAYTRSGFVHTNTDGNRAMRAPGHPQASFAIESLMDELAYAIGMSPLEFRMRNLADDVRPRQLDRVAREIGWYDHPFQVAPGEPDGGMRTGIGFGVSTWGGGGRRECVVTVRIEPDGSVSASVGSQDLGTGTRTYVAAITAEELGLEVSQVAARIGHSSFGQANGSGGSVTTASLAPAVKVAAHKARVALFERVAPWLEADPELLAVAPGGEIYARPAPDRRIAWSDACAALGSDPVVAVGEWNPDLQASGVHGAQAARVEVDTLTGAFRVVKMVCIQDCGLPLNRLALRSQINGGMVEALSYGLFEERVIDPWLGHALNANLDDYKLAGCREIPEMVAIVDDEDRREQVIGMAEATVIPGQSAIANAIHNACGVRLRELPLTPDKVLMGILERA